MSYVIAAYSITGLCLAVYALNLFRERSRQRKTLQQDRESISG